MRKELLGITLPSYSKEYILEEIIKHIKRPVGFFHIISLNPEIFVLTHKNDDFKRIVTWGRIKIIDGAGIYIAAKLLNIYVQERITGVELMESMLELAHERRLRVVLIGGKPKIAERVAECQRKKYFEAKIFAMQGISEIKLPKKAEEEKIFSIVADIKPHLIFTAFGSPEQEMWLYKNKEKFEASICMGVGGAFDFLSGAVPRAPRILRAIGFEWLFRLVIQPWRIKRQTRLIKFMILILQGELRSLFFSNTKER